MHEHNSHQNTNNDVPVPPYLDHPRPYVSLDMLVGDIGQLLFVRVQCVIASAFEVEVNQAKQHPESNGIDVPGQYAGFGLSEVVEY